MSFPTLEDLKMSNKDNNIVEELQDKVLESGYNLLKTVTEKYDEGITLQIATSESLTAGLIMSSLVKLPVAGWAKYGCFGVYDTDAKRVFNSVTVDDVYTHMCAKQMAIGMLKNSTATFAIAVSGNAMPYFDQLNRLGEVFIGIASYGENDNILYSTKSINSCLDNEKGDFGKKCKSWIKSQPDKNTFAKRSDTATISLLIRLYTAYAAMEMAVEFINDQNLKTPSFINERKTQNDKHRGCYHNNIPLAKYPENEKLSIKCVNKSSLCNASDSCMRSKSIVKIIPKTWKTSKKSKKKQKPRKKKLI